MRFKVDENLPKEAAELLRQAGYDAVTVLEEHLGGRQDRDVALACQQEGRALLTLDLDFADIRAYPPSRFPGLVVLRLRSQAKPSVLAMVQRLLWALANEGPCGALWIADERRIRIRRG